MSYKKYFLPVIVLAVFLHACSTNKKIEKIISPPFEGVNVPVSSFDFDASKDATFRVPSGTTIFIPAGSLVDAAGNKVTGPVNLHYREFHDAADILMSGIPMRYDSAGRQSDFISAGMFEIGASQNGQELSIAKDKKVSVQMASYTKGEDFNFYKLDTANGGWSYQGRTQSIPNPVKKKLLDSLIGSVVKPSEPRLADPANVFNFDVDYSSFPELKMFTNVEWEYAGNDSKEDPKNNEWIFNEDWRNISANVIDKEQSLYKIKLGSKAKSFEMTVKPVFDKKDLDKAKKLFDEQMVSYNDALKKAEEELARQNLEADILRTFELSSFGTCNWDTIKRMELAGEIKTVDAQYAIEKADADDSKIYLITNNDKSVRFCTGDLKNKMIYDPREVNKLIAILPGNFVAVYRSKRFSEIGDKTAYNFELESTAMKISSPQQLKDLIKGM